MIYNNNNNDDKSDLNIVVLIRYWMFKQIKANGTFYFAHFAENERFTLEGLHC